jgi:hypothetical protein
VEGSARKHPLLGIRPEAAGEGGQGQDRVTKEQQKVNRNRLGFSKAVASLDKPMDNELTKLRAFYKEVALMTLDHDEDNINGQATVSPAKLGKALEKVDPQWYTIKE